MVLGVPEKEHLLFLPPVLNLPRRGRTFPEGGSSRLQVFKEGARATESLRWPLLWVEPLGAGAHQVPVPGRGYGGGRSSTSGERLEGSLGRSRCRIDVSRLTNIDPAGDLAQKQRWLATREVSDGESGGVVHRQDLTKTRKRPA